jgi:hypothetical protein
MTDQPTLRDRLDSAIDDVFARWQAGLGGQRPQDAIRDAVLAVLPAPADRAAVLREAADGIVAENDRQMWATKPGKHWAAGLLRRMADEAQQPEAGPRRVQCGDCGAVGPVVTGGGGQAYLDPSGQIGHQPQTGPGGVHVFGTGRTPTSEADR